MKKLKDSYEQILDNWIKTQNVDGKELAHALHEFTSIVVHKDELILDDHNTGRKVCEESCDWINFTKIRGVFCRKCGRVVPF